MEETHSKKNGILIILALVLFLIIAPLGSWYYLQQGWDFQKEQAEALTVKGKFNLDAFENMSADDRDSLNDRTLLVGLFSDEKSKKDLESLLPSITDQFGERNDLEIILTEIETADSASFLGKDENRKQMWNAVQTENSVIASGLNIEKEVIGQWILIDYKNQIRGYYAPDNLENLVIHTAMILPKAIRPKIDLKRDKEK